MDKIPVHTHERRKLGGTTRTAWIGALLCVAATANAGVLTVTVTDRDGAPVRDAAVYAVPMQSNATVSAESLTAVVDQRKETFVPHVLVIQTGTAVEFPNHDTVRHHVYSFSDAKSFELPLYSGRAHAPIVFDTPGVVHVGCNIHDHMEAHIIVVDTPYFSVTSDAGTATLEALPAGEYAINVYTPRLPARAQPAADTVTLSTSDGRHAVMIDERLRPPHARSSSSLEWSGY